MKANFKPFHMKNAVKLLFVVVAMTAFVACGGGTDKAAAEKAKADSIAVADTIAKAAAQVAPDTTVAADSAK